MKNQLSKIIKFVSENKYLILIAGGILLVIIMLIVTALGGNEAPVEEGSIDQPLQQYENRDFQFTDDAFKGEYPDDGMKVYDLVSANQSDTVQTFSNKIGMGYAEKQNHNDIVYTWSKDDPRSDIEYNSVSDAVSFSFDEPISVNVDASFPITQSNAGEFFNAFVQNYFNTSFSYINVSAQNESGNLRITANRDIAGYPLEIAGHFDYSDYIVVDKNGDLIRGKIYLFQYDERKPITLEVLTALQLESVIGRPEYPKEINEFNPIGYEPEFTYKEGHGGDGSYIGAYDDKSPTIESCEADNMYLVYYYMNNQYDKLTPMYHVDCMGEKVIEGVAYSVPMIIYASAIDPEYVYIPATQ